MPVTTNPGLTDLLSQYTNPLQKKYNLLKLQI